MASACQFLSCPLHHHLNTLARGLLKAPPVNYHHSVLGPNPLIRPQNKTRQTSSVTIKKHSLLPATVLLFFPSHSATDCPPRFNFILRSPMFPYSLSEARCLLSGIQSLDWLECSIAWPKTIQPTHQRLVCLAFPARLPWFGGHWRVVYEDLCSFEVLAGYTGFSRTDELRKSSEKGGMQGGEDFLKGVQAIWSSSGCSYVVSGRCSVEQWLISIKPLSLRKWHYTGPITLITSDNTRPRNVTGMCCVDDCIEVCLYLFFLGVFFTMQIEDSSAHLQFSSGGFHPSMLGWFRSLSVLWVIGLFPSVWLRPSAEALLVECGCSLDVFTPVLAGYRPNVIQIGEGFWSRVVILTPLWAPQGCNHFPQPSG